MIQLVLCPGHIASMHDGEVHFITATQLAVLYGVPRNRCLIRPPNEDPASLDFVGRMHYLYLGPRYHGDYDLAKVLLEQSA